MKIIFTFLSIVLLFSCASTSKIESDCVSKLKIAFDTSWALLPNNRYSIKRNIQELKNIDRMYNDCILKLDSSQIIHALGTPSEIGNKFWQGTKYTISYSLVLLGSTNYRDAAYQFYCDSLNKVVASMFVIMAEQKSFE